MMCDKGWITACVRNVVNNAVRHAGAASSVHVTLRHDANNYVVRVENSGARFPRAVFDAFVKGEEKPEPVGSGLGLDMSRDFAESHGGRLELESEKPPVVKLTLPIRKT